ncbi:recombinase family protein [Salipiger sp. IMCC34102]|uniref:recombinase family protein n=1 Tax=Salipiger sp. IMCC34102 TaxID=2510647 RepID=UPI001F5DB66A|nr:recombinase family protein [Salipiger sp. IMCC34102]
MQKAASIEDQVRLCMERAERNGWTVGQTYTDMAISGASLHRPGLQSLMDGAAREGLDVVICEALDRLSRDQADVATLYKQLSFHGVRIETLSEGEISELHVGLKGTMNQLFLKDLAAKTRRGLRGRVEAGKSGGGNAYGYDVVRSLGPDGQPVTGERTINPTEAKIILRIFRAFADGTSPLAIAQDLNTDGIPGPRGKLWRDTAIRGHRARGTGILNNELYLGQLVWNRLRYIKDPATGRRVSRMNPEADWIRQEVPDLRIVPDDLWHRVKRRQGEIDATPAVQGIRKSRFWEKRRAEHLLTGKLVCGTCSGTLTAVGRDYLACSNARKLKTCDQRQSYRRGHLDTAVLDLLRDRLMQPEAVAEFVKSYGAEVNAERNKEVEARKHSHAALEETDRKLTGLYDAIADGLRTPGLLQKLEETEARKADLQARLAAPEPSPVRLHPGLSDLYRRKVADLATSLQDPAIRSKALETLRGLIERVTVRTDAVSGEPVLELEGAITAMIEEASPGALRGIDQCSFELVAGVGFEPTTFRL